MIESDWVDLPNECYLTILGYETENTKALDALIREYNLIPKDQVAGLPNRINKLNDVVDFVKTWSENKIEKIDKPKHLKWIAEISEKKKNYLMQLLQMYENKLHKDELQNLYHTDISMLKDISKTPIFLNNHRFFSLKMREYWGDFWYESLDPCHRRLTPFLDQWKAVKNRNPEQVPHFFLWLETQHIPNYIPRVTYLKGADLESKRVIIKDGYFWQNTFSGWTLANFHIPSKRYLFVIDLRGEIYVSEEGGGISHSSFSCGKPVMGAGLLQIHQGQLMSVALESGHYMPTIEIGHQILKIFEEKGTVFPDNLEISFFFDRNKYKMEFSAKPLPSLEQFKDVLESCYAANLRGCYESNAV